MQPVFKVSGVAIPLCLGVSDPTVGSPAGVPAAMMKEAGVPRILMQTNVALEDYYGAGEVKSWVARFKRAENPPHELSPKAVKNV